MKKIYLAPSILSADFGHLATALAQAEAAGANWIHLDVMDGSFVPNITFGAVIVAACRKITRLPLDVHLMINHPEAHLQAFVDAGANSLTVHVEACPHLHRTLQRIRELGCNAGAALNPGTPAAALSEIIPLLDLALVMTVNPGFAGQAFIAQMLPKIAQVRQMLDNGGSQAVLQVDGGITPKTLPLTQNAGANGFVAASAIFQHPQGIAAGIAALQAAAQ